MKTLLLASVLLSGCTFGLSGSHLFQPQGATVVLVVEDGRAVRGELLAVEDDGFLVDAVNEVGTPVAAVHVPAGVIRRGEVFAGREGGWEQAPREVPEGRQSPETRSQSRRRTSADTVRRVMRLGPYGEAEGPLDLRRLSRFPDGIPPSALARLLDARGQDDVRPYGEAPSRPAPR